MQTVTLIAGLVGATVFVVTALIDGATRAGYDPRRHAVSALALGERGWIQTANFLLCGGLIAASSFGVFRALDTPLGGLLIAIFGLSLLASGVFAMDSMRSYPPGAVAGSPREFSRQHKLHDFFGAVVFLSLPAAALVIGIAWTDRVWSIYSWITAAVVLALSFVFASAWENDAPNTGLIQRAMILVGWSWLALSCLRLLIG